MRCIYLWLRAFDLEPGDQPPIAPFAVVFFVRSDPPLRAVALAKALAAFVALQSEHVSAADPLELVSLCYKFTNSGVLGVMFYNLSLAEPYQHAQASCGEGNIGFDIYGNHPVSFWPPDTCATASARSYENMILRTR